jgi:hypothetical protein
MYLKFLKNVYVNVAWAVKVRIYMRMMMGKKTASHSQVFSNCIYVNVLNVSVTWWKTTASDYQVLKIMFV